jgi:hypothetical protein
MRRRSTCNRLPAASTLTPQATVSAIIDSALVLPRADLSGEAAIAQMADDMRLASQREGGITDRDLELKGWTGDQVKMLAPRANIRAQQLAGASI